MERLRLLIFTYGIAVQLGYSVPLRDRQKGTLNRVKTQRNVSVGLNEVYAVTECKQPGYAYISV